MDFFALAAETDGGEKHRGYKPKHTDPLVRDKANFRTGIEDQIEMIKTGGGKVNKAGNLSGNMFEKLADGKYRVTLKNGISVMKPIAGKEYFVVANADAAVTFLAAAAVAAEEGKFDDEFKRTARKVKAKEGKSVGANIIDGVKAGANGAHA